MLPLRIEILKAHSKVRDNFWQLRAPLKMMKNGFISPQKLFSFSRYLNFCPSCSETAGLER